MLLFVRFWSYLYAAENVTVRSVGALRRKNFRMGSRVCLGPNGTGLRTTGRTFMSFSAGLFNLEGCTKPVLLFPCSP